LKLVKKQMKIFLLFLALIVLHTTSSKVVPKSWVVDLDKDPSSRWPIKDMLPYYNDSIKSAMGLIDLFIPKEAQPIVYALALDVLPHLGIYAQELTALSNIANVPLEKIVLLNIMYEAVAGCTSIVAQKDDGTIIHGRNLDFPMTEALRNLTIDVVFKKSGNILYHGITFAGYVGLLTGMRPGAFSITVNERDLGAIWENLIEAIMVPGTYSTCFLIRDTLEQKTNFEDAVNILANAPLAAPVYLTIAGVNKGEGAIITRDRLGAADVWRIDPNNGRWFEVQTNDDHWKDPIDNRRDIANAGMKKVGQDNISFDTLYSVLKITPVYNEETAYTTLMCPKTGEMSTVIGDL